MGCSYLYRRGQYVVETIGEADDFADADGFRVLNFWQAQEQARQRANKRTAKGGQRMGPYTVGTPSRTISIISLRSNRPMRYGPGSTPMSRPRSPGLTLQS